MFYAHIVLAKKGPLARIWLAAHWDKKLTKAHVFETNIEQSVQGIMQPKVKLALRTSGHLLLGVVRIYSRKAKYLLADCNEAFVKIKMAFRPGMVDLPEGHREANVHAITLPEVFHDFDTVLPELNDIDIEAQFSANQSRADEITLREDYGSISMSMHDDGFGDIGFDADTPDLVREAVNSNINNQLFVEEVSEDQRERKLCVKSSDKPETVTGSLAGDGFGDEFGQPDVGLFEGDLFGESTATVIEEQTVLNVKMCASETEDNCSERVQSPLSDSVKSKKSSSLNLTSIVTPSKLRKSPHSYDSSFAINDKNPIKKIICEEIRQERGIIIVDDGVEQVEHLQNEEESFALAPIDASAYKGINKAKRKRKLIVDEIKNISGEEMKAQLANTLDIIATLDLAPPTKRLMYWKETGGVEKLFSLPSRDIPARGLFANFQRQIISRLGILEDFSVLGPADVLTLDHIYQEHDSVPIVQNKRGRKRKQAIPCDVLSLIHLPTFTETEKMHEQVFSHQHELSFDFETSVPTSMLTPPSLRTSECGNKSCSILQPENIEREMLEPLLSYNPESVKNLNDAEILEDFYQERLATNLEQDIIPNSNLANIDSIQNFSADQILTASDPGKNRNNNYFDQAKYVAITNSENLVSDWTDYDSVVVIQPEDEQLENETDEQFEERVLNKRAAQMFISVRYRLQTLDAILLSDITVGKSRKQAAQHFYSLLVLKKFRALNIAQPGPYEEISVTRGPSFDHPKV